MIKYVIWLLLFAIEFQQLANVLSQRNTCFYDRFEQIKTNVGI